MTSEQPKPNMKLPGWTFTKTAHTTTYPAIEASRPELSQAGRTVLMTGGGTGIGYGIAQSFAKASATRVIIVGRRAAVIEAAAAKLNEEAKASGSKTVYAGLSSDAADLAATESLWLGLKKQGIVVDVLVLNAASISEDGPLLERTLESVWYDFEMNARSILDYTQRFVRQEGTGVTKTKYLVHVSTSAIHQFETDAPTRPGYGLSKHAGALLLQQVAKDTSADKMQIVNYHPGGILSEAARNAGYNEDSFPWDDESLPADFAVWAASDEARFLHGRFVWARWDLDEIRTGPIEKRLREDSAFLKLGVVGL